MRERNDIGKHVRCSVPAILATFLATGMALFIAAVAGVNGKHDKLANQSDRILVSDEEVQVKRLKYSVHFKVVADGSVQVAKGLEEDLSFDPPIGVEEVLLLLRDALQDVIEATADNSVNDVSMPKQSRYKTDKVKLASCVYNE